MYKMREQRKIKIGQNGNSLPNLTSSTLISTNARNRVIINRAHETGVNTCCEDVMLAWCAPVYVYTGVDAY